jgi:murein L,D-transpeptidase YafK
MTILFNFLTGIILIFSVSFAHAQPILPRQILNLSSDERVTTNALLADKSQRELSVIDFKSFTEGIVKERYNIDIGKNTGDKKKRNDARTPEGIYLLLDKKAPPEIPFQLYGSMAFPTNYPNYFDKFENKTGSGIWLHSVPDKVPLTRGSRGCVVLRNNDIKKIEPEIRPKRTFLLIDSKVKWLPVEEHKIAKEEAVNWLEQWRSQWEKQDIDAYIQNYSDEFSAPPYNKKTWFRHKSQLKEKYTRVNVKLSDPNIFQVKSYFIFQFVQNYESDGHSDVGIKTLYVLKEGNSMRITREDWSPLQEQKQN